MGFEVGLRGDWKKVVWMVITTFALEIIIFLLSCTLL
jgi:hypothetical protein